MPEALGSGFIAHPKSGWIAPGWITPLTFRTPVPCQKYAGMNVACKVSRLNCAFGPVWMNLSANWYLVSATGPPSHPSTDAPAIGTGLMFWYRVDE